MAFQGAANTVVLGLPRGGVPVAYEIASILHLPLDVCLVRKLGVPGQPELAMGAIAANGRRVLNAGVVEQLGISRGAINTVTEREMRELERRQRTYQHHRDPSALAPKQVILVDDGIATGSTLRAALIILRENVESLLVAIPVAHPDVITSLSTVVDGVFCLLTPHPLHSISLWYDQFDQTSDQIVCQLLDAAQDMIIPPSTLNT